MSPATGAALVTGGAQRLGAVIVKTVAKTGRAVVIHYNRSREAAEALRRDVIAAGGAAFLLACDLTDTGQVETVIERATALAGPLDVLVNNAARFVFDAPRNVNANSMAAHFAPNLVAPVLLARDFAIARGPAPAAIINLLDQKLFNLNPDFFSYTLSKAALAAATEMLAMAFAPHVRVCGVAPGLTLIAERQSQENFSRGQAATPLRRGSTPEDIARAVRFIIETPSVTGTVLTVDAGEHLMHRQRDVSVDPM